MSRLTFEDTDNHFRQQGFYLIKHPIVIHHLLKDFADYEVIRYQFYILPAGEDYVHVALVEHETPRLLSWEPYVEMPPYRALQVRYSCAGDDILYGLRVKFNSGGSTDPSADIAEISRVIDGVKEDKMSPYTVYPMVREHPRYIRKRFRHGRFKAKLRAFLVMVRDKWRKWR